MSIDNMDKVKPKLNKIFGSPHFDGDATVVWKTSFGEFRVNRILNKDGYSVFIQDRNISKHFLYVTIEKVVEIATNYHPEKSTAVKIVDALDKGTGSILGDVRYYPKNTKADMVRLVEAVLEEYQKITDK